MNTTAANKQQELPTGFVIACETISVAATYPHEIIWRSAIIRTLVSCCLAFHSDGLAIETSLHDFDDRHLDGRDICNRSVGHSHKQDDLGVGGDLSRSCDVGHFAGKHVARGICVSHCNSCDGSDGRPKSGFIALL